MFLSNVVDIKTKIVFPQASVTLPDFRFRYYTTIHFAALVSSRICKLQEKGCLRLAAASDKVYQLLAHGRWFSPGTPASSTTKTGRHDIAEIFLKVALNTKKSYQIKINHLFFVFINTKRASIIAFHEMDR